MLKGIGEDGKQGVRVENIFFCLFFCCKIFLLTCGISKGNMCGVFVARENPCPNPVPPIHFQNVYTKYNIT